jgi:hypothetical protein
MKDSLLWLRRTPRSTNGRTKVSSGIRPSAGLGLGIAEIAPALAEMFAKAGIDVDRGEDGKPIVVGVVLKETAGGQGGHHRAVHHMDT